MSRKGNTFLAIEQRKDEKNILKKEETDAASVSREERTL